MQYEIRIWKDPTKVPNIKPHEAKNRFLDIQRDTAVKAMELMSGDIAATDHAANPDILIDKSGGGDDVIQSIDISYITQEVETIRNNTGLRVRGMVDNNSIVTTTKKTVRVIKIHIKGNLYLPLKENGIIGDAKSLIGTAKEEVKIKDTILLSQWASVRPEDDAAEHFYRGVVVSVLTRAGDFRVITAKKVYVDSYIENYTDGEFGTFELSLIEKVDSNADFKVAGLGYAEIPLLKSVGEKLEKASKVVATTGAVIAGVGTVGKAITETVEKFTGETAATRWIKYGFDTASSAGNVANNASNIVKNPKDVKTWTDGLSNINKDVNERIQKGVDAREDIPLEKMEAMYLSVIQKDPAKYEEYLKASQAEKYDMLKDASKTMRDRAAITKDMEESTAKEKKLSAHEKEIANLEKEYLALVRANPELSEKYNKASTEDKLKILQEQKKNFDDMQEKYLPLIKKDPATFDEYNKATTDQQLKMLQRAKDIQEGKITPKSSETSIWELFLGLFGGITGDSGTSTTPSSTDSGTGTAPSSTDSGTGTAPSSTDSDTGTAPSSTDSGTSTAPSSTDDDEPRDPPTPPSNNNASTNKPNSTGSSDLGTRISSAANRKNGK